MESSPKQKRKQIGLIVLSAIDVLTGVLSLVFAALAVQIVALMASGLTLIKAVKVAVQTEKTAVFVKPIAMYTIRRLTGGEKMKNFFGKIKVYFKNNPLTTVFGGIELAMCGGVGYSLLDFFGKYDWCFGWKLYAISFGVAALIYAVLLGFTIFLGYDSEASATIRKLVGFIGGNKAVEVLDKANEEVKAALAEEEAERLKEEEERAAKQAADEEREAEEQRIYEYALEQEEAKRVAAEKARRDRLVNMYKAEFEAKKPADTNENKA